jgi:hypothetical protein
VRIRWPHPFPKAPLSRGFSTSASRCSRQTLLEMAPRRSRQTLGRTARGCSARSSPRMPLDCCGSRGSRQRHLRGFSWLLVAEQTKSGVFSGKIPQTTRFFPHRIRGALTGGLTCPLIGGHPGGYRRGAPIRSCAPGPGMGKNSHNPRLSVDFFPTGRVRALRQGTRSVVPGFRTLSQQKPARVVMTTRTCHDNSAG